MSPFRSIAATSALLLLSPLPAYALQRAPAPIAAPVPPPPYAQVVDLAESSPVIVDAVIASTVRIKGPEAISVPAGMTRFYVEADVQALIRGPGAIPPRIGYLVDVSNGANGRPPQLKKLRVILFARPVAGSPGQLQLVNQGGQRDWNPATDELVRRIARELVAPDSPPVVTGIGNAFHVPGSLPGEGETQVFLTTRDNRPVSLNILRRPGEEPRWAVALSEIVDDAAGPPQRDTLLWYRLACALPPVLPVRSTQALEPADAAVAREDYRFVVEQLGACTR